MLNSTAQSDDAFFQMIRKWSALFKYVLLQDVVLEVEPRPLLWKLLSGVLKPQNLDFPAVKDLDRRLGWLTSDLVQK